jgi:hypothetical protein
LKSSRKIVSQFKSKSDSQQSNQLLFVRIDLTNQNEKSLDPLLYKKIKTKQLVIGNRS